MVNKIMIVDDDPSINYTIKKGIEGLDSNYKIITVESGKKCLDFLEKNQIPDLIILDIMMPELSGWETFQKIREKLTSDKLPIIFLTARKDQVAEKAGGFLGEDYIEKPIKIEELLERIERVLDRTQQKP
ncbi:chemotaxis protein CheY [Thermoplasmatales archaeon SG8-52-4]|nr:MAG: chemotaxis protein CheY [Thermoplasmatales archaeon SG8-52-4]